MSDIPAKIKIRRARAQYPNVFVAKNFEGEGRERYSITLILPKDHPDLAALTKYQKQVAQEKFGSKTAAVYKEMQASNRLAIHDGDTKAAKPGFADNLFINAGVYEDDDAVAGGLPVYDKFKDAATGKAKKLTAADGRIYAGCYVNAVINLWAQDNQWGRRINAKLLSVQFADDGEKLSFGATSDADDYEAVDEPAAEMPEEAGTTEAPAGDDFPF